MPAFSFHCPRFLRFRSSRSRLPEAQSPEREPSRASQPVTPVGVVPSNVVQQSLNSEPLIRPSGQYSPQPQGKGQGMFHEAHDLIVTGNFVDGNVGSITYNNTSSNQFMKELLEKTIPGAEFDSSDRDPPPRCHPGTRLDILERCLYFIANCDGKKKIRWVFGAAGVGKSAIMQNVAESPELRMSSHASVFFSINGRNDGTKAIVTLSYQLAAKSEPYRQLIEYEIARDPSLLRSSMAKQFLKLITEPFIYNAHLNSAGRVLIIIDGLDECNNPRTQQELLRLISDFCIGYPSSPLVWLIASRPEQHITSFFSRAEVMPACEKEEIPVDSDESRADVERFLRDELTEIKKASDLLDPQWPKERDFWKLADASGGLFAYAHTAIRYIGDSAIGSPVLQLSDVLNVIDNHTMTGIPREDHPMALLDALYTRILSNIPSKIMPNTRKLLLALASDSDWILRVSGSYLLVVCNWLGMTCDEAYAAINHLHSVLRIPRRDKVHWEDLEPVHKSFIDYISDFTRSAFSPDIQREAQQLMTQCAFRILREAPYGIDFDGLSYEMRYGTIRRGPGTGDKISLAWTVGEGGGWNDTVTRLNVYKLAIGQVVAGVGRGDPSFQNEFCIRLLINQFKEYRGFFPSRKLRDLLFDESRRHEFMMHGILKQMPLRAVNISAVSRTVKLQFRRPATTLTNLSDPWNSSCDHGRKGEWEGVRDQDQDQDWKTTFGWYGARFECFFCLQRLQHQMESWKSQSPDHTVLIALTSTEYCFVELRFVDPDDGISEWTYWFWFKLSSEERKKYGTLYHV